MKAIYLGKKHISEQVYYKEYIVRFLGETLFFTKENISFIYVLQSWCDRKAGRCIHRLLKHKAKWYDNVWLKIISFIEFRFVRPLYQKERDKTLTRLD